MIEVNGLGQACPIPVVMTKKALRENAGKDNICVVVDNKVATENLAKMATQIGLEIETIKVSEKEYRVIFKSGENNESPVTCSIIEKPSSPQYDEYVVAISADEIGNGDSVLGKKLLEGFIYALGEQDILPAVIVFYNGGVRLTAENKKTIEDLKTLENRGCEIMSCGLCLDFYDLKEKLQVGSVTNMYRIIEVLRSYRVVRP